MWRGKATLNVCCCYVQSDVDRFVEIAEQLWTTLGHDVDQLDVNLIRQFGSCAAGQLCPMHAVIGGIAAQEILKVLSSSVLTTAVDDRYAP